MSDKGIPEALMSMMALQISTVNAVASLVEMVGTQIGDKHGGPYVASTCREVADELRAHAKEVRCRYDPKAMMERFGIKS